MEKRKHKNCYFVSGSSSSLCSQNIFAEKAKKQSCEVFLCFDKNRFLCGASFAFVSKFVLGRGDSGWSNFQLIEFLIGRKAVKLKILHLQSLTSDGLNFAKARSSWQRQNKFLFDRTSIKDIFLVLLTFFVSFDQLKNRPNRLQPSRQQTRKRKVAFL